MPLTLDEGLATLAMVVISTLGGVQVSQAITLTT